MLLLSIAAAASCAGATTNLVSVAVTSPSYTIRLTAECWSIEARAVYLRLTRYTIFNDTFCYVEGGSSNSECTALNCRKSNIQ